MEIITHSREWRPLPPGGSLLKRCRAGRSSPFTRRAGRSKTAFCQGLAEGLGCTTQFPADVRHRQLLPRPAPAGPLDLYRIHTENDLAAAGFTTTSIWVPSWPVSERELRRPARAKERPSHIHIDRVDETTRKLQIG